MQVHKFYAVPLRLVERIEGSVLTVAGQELPLGWPSARSSCSSGWPRWGSSPETEQNKNVMLDCADAR